MDENRLFLIECGDAYEYRPILVTSTERSEVVEIIAKMAYDADAKVICSMPSEAVEWSSGSSVALGIIEFIEDREYRFADPDDAQEHYDSIKGEESAKARAIALVERAMGRLRELDGGWR